HQVQNHEPPASSPDIPDHLDKLLIAQVGTRSRPRRHAAEPPARRPAAESGTPTPPPLAAADPHPAPPPPFAVGLSTAPRRAHTRYPERAAPPAHHASTPAGSPHGYPAGCASRRVCGAPAPASQAVVRRHPES